MNSKEHAGDRRQTIETSEFVLKPASVLTGAEVVRISAYGFLLLIPVVIALMYVSVRPFGLGTWLLPVLVLLGSLTFLPLGFGNTRVRTLVRRIDPEAGKDGASFVVQVTCEPRLARGGRAVFEDADDIGCLRLTQTGMVYTGDAVSLNIPYAQVRRVARENIGWRGLFVYGPVIVVQVEGLTDLREFRFGERCSWTLFGSRRTALSLYQRLRQKTTLSLGSGA